MRLIGFTGNWVAPIVEGSKTVTTRKASSALPRPGEIVGFRCRYDRPPFAYGRIVEVAPIFPGGFKDWAADGFSSWEAWAETVEALYGMFTPLVAVRWVLVDGPPETPPALF